MWIDSHCHLEPDDFRGSDGSDERPAVLKRALEAGVRRLVVVGSGHGRGEIDNALAIAYRYPDIVLGAAIGIHPHDAGRITSEAAGGAGEELFGTIETLAQDPRVVAVGETGLDYHYQHSTPSEQQTLLRRFLRLAMRLRKPVSLHIRSDERSRASADAHADARRIVREEWNTTSHPGGVIHCFTGTPDDARAWLDLGFAISLSGIVTFKSAEPIRQAAELVPKDRLLLETDCPYLAPIPKRGMRNEPAFLVHTAEAVARLRGVSLERLAEETSHATERLFAPPASA